MKISSILLGLFAAALPVLAADEKPAPAPAPPAPNRKASGRVEADLNAIRAALTTYKLNAGVFPTEEQGLKALVEKPTLEPLPKRWIIVMQKVPQDPWKRDYLLKVRVKEGKKETLLMSNGPDAEDKADDIELVIESVEVEKK